MEPMAIIVCGGADQPYLDYVKTLQQDYQQLVFVGVDAGCVALLEAGYDLDHAVGDFDSITPEARQRVAAQARHFHPSVPEKDDTDMELALAIVVETYPEGEVYLFGVLGASQGRLDHTVANLWLFYQPRYQSLVHRTHYIEYYHQVRFYQAGTHRLPVHYQPRYLSIISMTPVKALSIQQAKYTLAPIDLAYPRAYISNEFIDGQTNIELSLQSGLVMAMWVNHR